MIVGQKPFLPADSTPPVRPHGPTCPCCNTTPGAVAKESVSIGAKAEAAPTRPQIAKADGPSLAEKVSPLLMEHFEATKDTPDEAMVIRKDKVDAWCKQLDCSTDALSLAMLGPCKLRSHPAISQFQVSAVGLGVSGNLYIGVNTEQPNLTLQHTTHGEQGVVNAARTAGEAQLSTLAVTAAPCGHCRQFLNELVSAKGLKIMVPGQDPETLKTELPKDFGPQDLGVEGALLSPKNNGLTIAGRNSVWSMRLNHQLGAKLTADFGIIGDAAQSTINATRIPLPPSIYPPEDKELAAAALSAANRAYAPYTKDPSGVAVRMKDGSIIKGFYSENAAFNPTLNPIESALITIAVHGHPWDEIAHVVLVEPASAGVSPHETSQVEWTLDTLSHVAPDAICTIYQAQRPA